MKTPKLFTILVHFDGRFPTDMLRYDQCWPRTQHDVEMIDLQPRSRTAVTVCSHRKPTGARWRSFGCDVTVVRVHDANGREREPRASEQV